MDRPGALGPLCDARGVASLELPGSDTSGLDLPLFGILGIQSYLDADWLKKEVWAPTITPNVGSSAIAVRAAKHRDRASSGEREATISAHGGSSSSSARRASTSSAASASRGGGGGGGGGGPQPSQGRASTRRSPSKKQTSAAAATEVTASSSPTPVASVTHSAAPGAVDVDGAFNPLVALQSVAAGDLVPIKQRSKAAQQLATYFCELPTTPSLYAYYEPYLPVLASVVVTPVKAAKDVQENVVKMLKALASHSPRQFVEWCALHVSMDPTQEPWYVDWCGGLLLAAETRLPRLSIQNGVSDVSDTTIVWDERSMEFQELDAATAAVFHVWRSVLDNADDEDIVYEIAVGIKTLICYQPEASEHAWRALVTSKIQPHFVDMTDVLIGWAMSTTTSRRLREAIFALLEELRELWIGNSVFCMQLLESFASDIGAIYASPTSTPDDFGRLDSIILCSTLVAQFIPVAALTTRSGQLGFVEVLLRSSEPSRFYYSSETVLRLSEYLDALASAGPERFVPLKMRAIRFLLNQVAYQVACGRCDMHSALCIIEKAAGFASTLSEQRSNADSRLQAKQFLSDTVAIGGDKQDDRAVVEVLLSLKYFAAAKYCTQIVIHTSALIGMEGLQVIATMLDNKTSAQGDGHIAFWVTCFILVCKDPRLSGATQDAPFAKKTIELLLSIVQRAAPTAQAAPSGLLLPGALRLVPVFLSILKKPSDPELVDPWTELVSAQVELGVSILRSHASDSAVVRDTLASLAWSVSSLPTKASFPAAIQASIIEQLHSLWAQDAVAMTAECVKLLVAMAPRVTARAVCTRLIGLATELVHECGQAERATLFTKVFPFLGPTALRVAKESVSASPLPWTNGWKRVRTPSEMLVGDFERIFELLSHPDTTSDAWYRTSRRIHARMRREQREEDVCEPSTLMKTIVREAAKWVVLNRLRSPLGPPSAIFSGVEKMLHVHANHHTVGRGVVDPGSHESTSAALLVEFVLAMEVLFGAATDVKCPDTNPDSDIQKVQGFFRANVGVCEEWLSRIRPALVELSSSLRQCESLMHHSNATVTTLARKLEAHLQRHSTTVQSDEVHVRVMKYTIDLEGAVFTFAKSLCALGDADSITGLQTWWGDLLSRLTNVQAPSASEWEQRLMLANANSRWLEALAYQAELKYEDAVKCFGSILSQTMQYELHPQASPDLLLHPLLSPIGLSLNTFVGCMRECGKCLATLRRWDHLRDLSARCQAFALGLSSKWGRVPALTGLIELCEAWAIEEPWATSLALCDGGSTGLSPMNPSFAKEEAIGTRALSVLQKWGAFGAADRSSASSASTPVVLDDVGRVTEWVQALRLRPTGCFSDTLSPTSLRFQESTLLAASLLTKDSDGDRQELLERLQLVIGDVGEYSCDATQWSRLYTKPSRGSVNDVDPEWWLALARAARKQKNYAFAASMLGNLHGRGSVSEASNLALLYENSVLSMAGDSSRDGVFALIKLCESVLDTKDSAREASLSHSVHMRSLLRLARTLADVTTGDDFGSVEAAMSIMGARIEKHQSKGLVEYRDSLVMICLESATRVSPTNPQAWYEFSKWCHQQGRQRLEKIIADEGQLELLPSEEARLDSLLHELYPEGSHVEKANIRAAFRRAMEGGSLLSNHEERLRRALAGSGGEEDLLDRFVALQAAVVSRLLRPIKDAAMGYRSFLLTVHAQTESLTSRRDSSRITSVALRLLRILTRFGSESELVGAIADVFTSGPLDPWGRIVPQLLSRIGHSYADVSNLVAAVLVRLARRYPHLVVYPAVVEAGRKHSAQEGTNQTSKKLLNDVLVELRRCASDLVEGVGRMVEELKRISILWDDAWIWALVKMSGDVNRRISTLEKEAHRVDKNSTLSSDEKDKLARRKAVAIMTPVLVAVERLWVDTLGRAVPGATLTPHEKQFAHKYGSTISKAIQVFRNYCSTTSTPADPNAPLEAAHGSGVLTSPAEVWQPFADLLKGLAASVGRRDRVDLAEISPILARTSHKSKAALMPGTVSSESFTLGGSQTITVSEVSRNVAVLRTKTKPKCLKFVGSDGQAHRYLLKAREDLHLDERIMQFLETVNEFLRADRGSNARNLHARTYSVVPLSSDAGLIQIVPDVLPLFQMYTSRVEDTAEGALTSGPAAAAATAADPVDTSLPLQQPPTAPFYAKLKQYGIQDVAPSQRARWPLSILRRVHEDLVSARPANVIHRAIAAQSVDFADAWTKKYRFGRSTAVMSVLGYLVGLGDRHLDNMLLCATTGELLHIDYNVCFDKGRKLKVPEVVPFRLTPIMVDGLGLTGVDGVYRSAFVNTLRVVRDPDSREALLALLDAFVYDPLVDWMADGRNHAISRDTKQRMDVNVNLSLFLSRARERSQETTTFVQQFTASSTALEEALTRTNACIGEMIASQGLEIVKANELKSLAEAAVRHKEREWAELSSTNPQQEAALAAVRELMETDKARIASFANQCQERHQHIQQMRVRVSSYVPGAAIAFLPRTSVGALVRAHARIMSIAVQLPLSPSASVWMNMLTSLEARCLLLDQQIPPIVDRCDRVVGTISPMLQEYAVRRGVVPRQPPAGAQLDASGDVYGVWCNWCSKLLEALERSEYASVVNQIRIIKTQLVASATKECSRLYHANVVAELEKEAAQLRSVAQVGRCPSQLSVEVDTLVQEFLNNLSALKLSNSQTHRVVKLINTRWILSSLEKLDAKEVQSVDTGGQPGSTRYPRSLVRSLHSISHVAIILRSLASAAKGSMKKIIVEMLGNGPRQSSNERDWIQAAFECVSDVLGILDSIFSRSVYTMMERQYGVKNAVVSGAVGVDGAVINSATNELFSALVDKVRDLQSAHTQLGLSSTVLAELETYRVSVQQAVQPAPFIQDAPPTSVIADRLTAAEAAFASHGLVPIVKVLLHHIATREWGFSRDLDLRNVDTLALEAMPTIVSSPDSPLSGFRNCCDAFDRLWSVWSAQSTEDADDKESQRRLQTVETLQQAHKRHIESLDWSSPDQAQGQLTRSELLNQISLLAPTLPRLFEEMGHVESNLLEVAQQLEYVASQIGFSCAMGMCASEIELQAICRDVQDLYNQTSRHFEVTKEMCDVALGASTIETSSVRIGAETAPSSLEVEVNQVGESLLAGIEERTNQAVHLSCHRLDSPTRQLQGQLQDAREESAQAGKNVSAHLDGFVAACAALDTADVCTGVTALEQQALRLLELLESIGVHGALPDANDGHSSPAKPGTSSRKTTTHSRFALAENERLVMILHRSVEPVSFMQELNSVLSDHDLKYQQLQLKAAALSKALSTYCDSARQAVNSSDVPSCVLAVQELVFSCEEINGARSTMSAASAVLEACCQRFFDAAHLADELTKAEDLAPTFEGMNGQPGDDPGNSEENGDEDLDLLNEDLDNSMDPPVRPLAELQEQNRYGVDVVARIDEKLGGVVVESGSRDPLTIEEQSSWLIRAATKVDNLCVMYEGWTPWI